MYDFRSSLSALEQIGGDAPERPSVSVVIATINEDLDLEAMLTLLLAGKTRPDEIIVVDDCSVEPIEPRVSRVRAMASDAGREPVLRVLRNDRRLGVGASRHRGVEDSSGDLVIVCDSHLRPPYDFLDLVLEAHRKHPYSVLCPRSIGFRAADAEARHHGARFALDAGGYWVARWNPPRQQGDPPLDDGAPIGCVMGACYAASRSLLDRIGGFGPCLTGWGADEEFLSLRAYLCGFDCRLLGFDMPHHYRKTDEPKLPSRVCAHGTEPEKWRPAFNRHVLMSTCFEDGVYERSYAPTMWRTYGPNELRDALAGADEQIRRLRALLQERRTRSDAELTALLGVPHPVNQSDLLALASRGGRVML